MFELRTTSRSGRTAQRALGLAMMLSSAWGALTAGCSGSVQQPTAGAKACTLNSDCTSPLVCSFGTCHVACATSADCGRSEKCVSDNGVGVCQPNQEASCTRNSDCPGKLTCAVDATCRSQCANARDCLSGQVCATGGVCADTADVGAGNTLKGGRGDAGPVNAGGATGAGGTSGMGTGLGGGMTAGGSPGAGGTKVDPGAGGTTGAGRDAGPPGTGGGVGGAPGSGGGFGTGGTTSGCSAGFHSCGGQCVSDTSLTQCGAACAPCTAPSNGSPVCSGGGCSFTCNAPYVKSGSACVPPPPRLLLPSSGTTVGTRLPTLKWQSPPGSTGSFVEVCAERACSNVLFSASVAASTVTVDTALPRGLVFWRVFDGAVPDGGTPSGSPSATWELTVQGTHDAPRTTGYGVVPDFNGDGFADVLITTSTNLLTVYPGSVSGLANSTLSWTPSGGGGPNSTIPVGDIDGDGYVDIVLGGFAGVEVHGGSPSGLSSAAKQTVNLQAGGAVTGETGSAIADYDGDGYADFLYGTQYTDAQQNSYLVLNLLSGGPNGLSSTPVQKNTTALFKPGPMTSLSSCDVNGDGYMDVLYTGFMGGSSGTLSVFYGSASGLDGSTPGTVTLSQNQQGASGCGGDLNGDGYDDAVLESNNGLYVLYGAAAGLGNPGSAFSAGAPNIGGGFLPGLGDVNGDGYADVVAPSSTSPNLLVYLGSSGGVTAGGYVTIVPPPPPSFTVQSSGLNALTAVGDVDHDGFADVGVGVNFQNASAVHNQQVYVFKGGASVSSTPVSTLPLAINGML